jgi:hypothetical protein
MRGSGKPWPGRDGRGRSRDRAAADHPGQGDLGEVAVTACGDKVIAPALRLTAARLARATTAPFGQHAAAHLLLGQVDLLWRRHIIDYLLLRAVRP